MNLEDVSYDCWSIISNFFARSSSAFNVMLVSKGISQVFNNENLDFFENVAFSLWPFEKESEDNVSWLSNNNQRIWYVTNLEIGPLDNLQRRLVWKRRERGENEKSIFSGNQTQDESVMRLIFKKFPRLKNIQISSLYPHNLRIRSSIFLVQNYMEKIRIVHPHSCLIDRKEMFSEFSRISSLKSLSLEKQFLDEKFNTGKSSILEFTEPKNPSFERLESLRLEIVPNSLSLKKIVPHLSLHLTSLDLKFCNTRDNSTYEDYILKTLLKSTCIRKLTIRKLKMDRSKPRIDNYLKHLTHLESLSLFDCCYIDGTMFSHPQGRVKETLRKLFIKRSRFTAEIQSNMIGDDLLKNLTDLSIVGSSFMYAGDSFFQQYYHLRRLDLRNFGGEVSIEGFRSYQDLEYLNISSQYSQKHITESFVTEMFKNNPRLEYIIVNECDPNICETSNFYKRRTLTKAHVMKCPDPKCHSSITREMMLDPKYENDRPEIRRPRFDGRNRGSISYGYMMWYVPGSHKKYFPFQKCENCCQKSEERLRTRGYTHSEFTTCGSCGYSYCVCCAGTCGAHRYSFTTLSMNTRCDGRTCPRCSLKCKFCEASYCSPSCILDHMRVFHKEEYKKTKIGRKRSNSTK